MTEHRADASFTLVNLDSSRKKPWQWDPSYVFDHHDAPLPPLARAAVEPPRPILPVDASGAKRFAGKDATVKLELWTLEVDGKNEKKTSVLRPGTKLAIMMKNTGTVDLRFELALTKTTGAITLFRPAANLTPDEEKRVTTLTPGEVRRFPTTGGIAIGKLDEGEPAKQRVIVYAAAEPFPPGVVLNPAADKLEPGYSIAGRVVHPFYQIDGKKIKLVADFDPAKMVRQVIEFETETK
jgi:hypothetical protein